MNKVIPIKKKFDPDVGPEHPTNIAAAKNRGLRFSIKDRGYVDEDGALIRDRFGQPL